MSKIQKALQWMLNIAADNSHGYSQQNRWGPDYDCSSMVIQAFENAGVPVKSAGATYTGNMRPVFLRNGFTDVTNKVNLSNCSGMQPGDVLLNQIHHTAMYAGNGKIVHARGQSYGSPAPGDQGREIAVTSYYNYPWDCVLRYTGTDAGDVQPAAPSGRVGTCTVQLGEYIPGCVDPQVKVIQRLLRAKGFKGKDKKALVIDGEFGENTAYAVTRMQKKAGMKNINFGTVSSKTWGLLLE